MKHFHLTLIALLISFASFAVVGPITGANNVCVSGNTTLTDTSAGGTWSSSAPSIATIGSSSGIVTGVAAGNTTITYTTGSGFVTMAFTVNPVPTIYTLFFSGSGGICAGTPGTHIYLNGSQTGVSYQLYNAMGPAGSAMTGTGAVLDFGIFSDVGAYYGIARYIATGCTSMTGPATLTMLPSPAPIAGPSGVCVGSTITLTNTTTGGTWSSSNPTLATVGSTGVVTGLGTGTAIISYTISSGCSATQPISVINTVLPITGPTVACTGQTSTLMDASAGGTWSSSNPSVASIGSSSGIVLGMSTGTTAISYTVGGGCGAVGVTVSVRATPAGITGITSICAGAVSSLHSTTTGGTWSSTNTSVATIGSLSGVAVGVAAGTAPIKYTVAGCSSGTTMTIDAPPVISGPHNVCATSTIVLNTTINGSWTSSNPAVASVVTGFMTGTVTGVYPGTTIMTCNSYSTGCVSTYSVTVTSSCTGTPSPGVTHAAFPTICVGNADLIYLTGYSTVCGTAYQWQSSTDSLAWSNIPGANDDSFVANPQRTLFYRCKLTCFSTGLYSYSVPVRVSTYNSITSHNVINTPSFFCNGPDFQVNTCGRSTTTNIKTWYGDGTSDTTLLSTTSADIFHTYNLPGTYTVKQVLREGITPYDSITFSYSYDYCRTLPVFFYFDANSNCIKDGGDGEMYRPVVTEVDSNGVHVDTITAINGFYYKALGSAGTVYRFRVISYDTGLHMNCPVSGIQYDTITSYENNYPTRYFGFNCSSSTAFNLGINAGMTCGRFRAGGAINVYNTHCPPQSTVVTMNFSPKYDFLDSYPAPFSVSGHTVVWHISPLSVYTNSSISPAIRFNLTVSGAPLTTGDTAFSNYRITPVSGDVDTTNNSYALISTIISSFDPNRITVSPAGTVIPCTPLNYTIDFENTGNDTARNIYITDTLPDNVDIRSIKLVASSAPVNMAIVKYGTRAMIKFDFPGINLPDSSHHNLCHGFVTFSVKAKPGLADGSTISNKARIYFDDNPPVLTNTISNVIGISPITGPNQVCAGMQIHLANASENGTWGRTNTTASVVQGLVTGLVAGVDTITYTLSNSCASRTVNKSVTINPIAIPAVNIATTIGMGDTVCDGTAPVFVATPVNGGSSPTYQWQVNGVNSGTNDTFSYMPPVNGDVVSVEITSNANCATPDTAVTGMVLTVITPYIPPITLNAYPGIFISPGTRDTFVATVSGSGPQPTYQWLLNGVPIPGETSDTFITNTLVNGDSITCIATSTDLCKLSVFNSFIITVGNVGIRNPGGNTQMVLFPNPNNGAFTIKGITGNTTNEDAMLEIINTTGQVVHSKQLSISNGTVNEQIQLSNGLAKGMYMLSLRCGGDNIVFRFVVE